MPSSEQASQNSKDHPSASQQPLREDQNQEDIHRQPVPTELNPRARGGPHRLTSGEVLQLQSTVGNRTLQRLMSRPAESPRPFSAGPTVVARNGPHSQDIYEEDDNPYREGVPPGEWGPEYRKRRSRIGESYETYESTIGKNKARPELKAASEWGGRQVKTTITTDQLTRIINAAGEPKTTARIAPMAGQMSSAFDTMSINTAQAQAAYIAHMAGETGGVLEEKEGEKRSYAPFQGRGPVQVTHEENYVQTLAYIEKRIEQLEKDIADKEKRITELEAQKQAGPPAEGAQAPAEGGQAPADPTAEINRLKAEVEKAKKQVQDLREAHSAVKGDPKKAADPKYAFLFSAAYMHMTGGVRASARLGATAAFVGNRPEDAWVTGGNVQQVEMPDGTKKNVSMTFEQRRQYAAEHDLSQLERDMKSAISRGDKKSKVYGMAVSVLSSENAIPASGS
jgi:hypothetical protein